jgi:hypothetical protein
VGRQRFLSAEADKEPQASASESSFPEAIRCLQSDSRKNILTLRGWRRGGLTLGSACGLISEKVYEPRVLRQRGRELGGVTAVAGSGGSQGISGGVFGLGTFSRDAATVIKGNHASTSDEDIFPYRDTSCIPTWETRFYSDD